MVQAFHPGVEGEPGGWGDEEIVLVVCYVEVSEGGHEGGNSGGGVEGVEVDHFEIVSVLFSRLIWDEVGDVHGRVG